MADKKSLPSFFVIGVQKSATSFLHSLLKQDVKISLPYRKETHFFSRNFDKEVSWYLKMFDSKQYDVRGEIDPSYIHYSESLNNIKKIIKNPKFIILFRKPIDRAYSHYLMSRKRNYEKLSFNQALHSERNRLLNDNEFFSFSNHSYMLRGNYIDQIARSKRVFPNSKFLFIKFDDLINKNRVNVVREVYKFINIDFNENINFNVYKHMSTNNRSKIIGGLLYNYSNLRKIIKRFVPSEYYRFKIIDCIEKLNSYRNLDNIKNIDYSIIDRKFIDWNNKQSLLLKKETNLYLDDWIINE